MDPYRYCLRCLGLKHDTTTCELHVFLSLSWKTFRSGFIKHYLWLILPPSQGLPDKPPTFCTKRVSTITNSQTIIDVDGEEKFHSIVDTAVDIQKDYLQKFPKDKSGSNCSNSSALPSTPTDRIVFCYQKENFHVFLVLFVLILVLLVQWFL